LQYNLRVSLSISVSFSIFIACHCVLTRNIDIAILSVRPSVSCVPVFCGNGLTYCHSFFTTRWPNHSRFSVSNIFAKFRLGHPCRGTKHRLGIKISLYLANDTR